MTEILVVDDHLLVCDHACSILERAGYRAVAAQSGHTGLDILECEPIDLILLDLIMEAMSGNEFLTRLRMRNDRTPVVLMTAWIDRLHKDLRGYVAGAVIKPFKEIDLLESVDEALKGASK